MPVEVAIGSDVHHDVIHVGRGTEIPKQFIAPRSGAESYIDHFIFPREIP